jgi:hypothetical protein
MIMAIHISPRTFFFYINMNICLVLLNLVTNSVTAAGNSDSHHVYIAFIVEKPSEYQI